VFFTVKVLVTNVVRSMSHEGSGEDDCDTAADELLSSENVKVVSSVEVSVDAPSVAVVGKIPIGTSVVVDTKPVVRVTGLASEAAELSVNVLMAPMVEVSCTEFVASEIEEVVSSVVVLEMSLAACVVVVSSVEVSSKVCVDSSVVKGAAGSCTKVAVSLVATVVSSPSTMEVAGMGPLVQLLAIELMSLSFVDVSSSAVALFGCSEFVALGSSASAVVGTGYAVTESSIFNVCEC
jgi:hypothetical protein